LVCNDRRIRTMLNNFIPAIEDEWAFGAAVQWKWKDDPKFGEEVNTLGRIVAQGHMKESAERFHVQGFYVIAPSGKLLASANTVDDPGEALQTMREGLAKWQGLSKKDRLRNPPPDPDQAQVRERQHELFPKDGLALRTFTRDLSAPHIKAVMDHTTGTRYYRNDSSWFRRDEVEGFLPMKLVVGAKREVPRELAEHFARFDLGTNVNMQIGFEPESVKRAELRSEVVSVKDNRAELRFEGATRAEQEGEAYEGDLLGKATYDTKSQKFVAFELISVGTRIWKKRDGQLDHGPASPLGTVLILDSDYPFPTEPPFHLQRYGWK
jgi:hypothetical protein